MKKKDNTATYIGSCLVTDWDEVESAMNFNYGEQFIRKKTGHCIWYGGEACVVYLVGKTHPIILASMRGFLAGFVAALSLRGDK